MFLIIVFPKFNPWKLFTWLQSWLIRTQNEKVSSNNLFYSIDYRNISIQIKELRNLTMLEINTVIMSEMSAFKSKSEERD